MNDHPETPTLSRYLDDELSSERRQAVEAHLSGCHDCRKELELLAEIDRSAAELPVPDPPLGADESWRRIAGRRGGGRERSSTMDDASGRRWLTPAAAAVLLLAVIGGAAALPGSPFRAWMAARVADVAPEPVSTGEVAAPELPGEAGRRSGVGVAPRAGEVSVHLPETAAGTRLHVRVGESTMATVWGGDVRVTTAPGEVRVTGFSGDELTVEFPSDLALGQVTLGDRIVVEKQGPIFEFRVPRVDSTGSGYRVRLGEENR